LILLDTSGLLAAVDSSQRAHRESATSLAAALPPRPLSRFVLAELDYLLTTRVGLAARRSVSHSACCRLTLDRLDDHDVRPADASR
jgi:predicted nucleic acid-binding protein